MNRYALRIGDRADVKPRDRPAAAAFPWVLGFLVFRIEEPIIRWFPEKPFGNRWITRFRWKLMIRVHAVPTALRPPCCPIKQEGDVSHLCLSSSGDEQSFDLVQKLLLCHTVSLEDDSFRTTIRNRTVAGFCWHATHGVVLEAQYQIGQDSYFGGIVLIMNILSPPHWANAGPRSTGNSLLPKRIRG